MIPVMRLVGASPDAVAKDVHGKVVVVLEVKCRSPFFLTGADGQCVHMRLALPL